MTNNNVVCVNCVLYFLETINCLDISYLIKILECSIKNREIGVSWL